MSKKFDTKIDDILKTEAKRYAEEHNLSQYRRKRTVLPDITFLRNLKRHQKYGLAAISICFPSAATLILGSGTGMKTETAVICMLIAFASLPFWFLAERARVS